MAEEDLKAQRRIMSDICCRVANFHGSAKASANKGFKAEAREQLMMECYNEVTQRLALRVRTATGAFDG